MRWFGHISRRPETIPVCSVEKRGRPRKTRREVIKKDMTGSGMIECMIFDRGSNGEVEFK